MQSIASVVRQIYREKNHVVLCTRRSWFVSEFWAWITITANEAPGRVNLKQLVTALSRLAVFINRGRSRLSIVLIICEWHLGQRQRWHFYKQCSELITKALLSEERIVSEDTWCFVQKKRRRTCRLDGVEVDCPAGWCANSIYDHLSDGYLPLLW